MSADKNDAHLNSAIEYMNEQFEYADWNTDAGFDRYEYRKKLNSVAQQFIGPLTDGVLEYFSDVLNLERARSWADALRYYVENTRIEARISLFEETGISINTTVDLNLHHSYKEIAFDSEIKRQLLNKTKIFVLECESGEAKSGNIDHDLDAHDLGLSDKEKADLLAERFRAWIYHHLHIPTETRHESTSKNAAKFTFARQMEYVASAIDNNLLDLSFMRSCIENVYPNKNMSQDGNNIDAASLSAAVNNLSNYYNDCLRRADRATVRLCEAQDILATQDQGSDGSLNIMSGRSKFVAGDGCLSMSLRNGTTRVDGHLGFGEARLLRDWLTSILDKSAPEE